MKIVATNRIVEAQAKYPAVHDHLQGWFQIISSTDFENPSQLRRVFGDMRGFNSSFKFPIPDSNLLAHTSINFEACVVLVEDILPGNH
ncbi:MAG: type II toxin-antitoxin system HigB family toxin [Kangiellaceae bacterium]|nr:type II toxin-antitoxin system HigB family toxin [Kangiellaceae bacterium]